MARGLRALCAISIHALREEGDAKKALTVIDAGDFYPRPPRGGRPVYPRKVSIGDAISIHALREEGDPRPRCISASLRGISIHALREEGDTRAAASTPRASRFLSTPSARRATGERGNGSEGYEFLSTPSARRATPVWLVSTVMSKFLSTPSARRATRPALRGPRCPRYFYPRPPRGGRPTPSLF